MIIMIMTTLFITIFHAKDGDFFHLITIDTTTTHMHIKQRDGRRACFTHNFSVPSASSQFITVTLREMESTFITVTVLPSFLILIISLTLLQHHTVMSIVCKKVNRDVNVHYDQYTFLHSNDTSNVKLDQSPIFHKEIGYCWLTYNFLKTNHITE